MYAIGTATVTLDTVLLQTDAPEIAIGRDPFKGLYLCLLVRIDEEGHHYLAVRISEERLVAVQHGRMDLRTAFEQPEESLHFFGRVPADATRMEAKLEAVTELHPEWLPDADLRLTDFEKEIREEPLVLEAVSRNAAVVVCRLSPPESLGAEPKINADRLAECISDFQSLVRQATKAILKKMKDADRKAAFGENPSVLQVVALSPGSVNVHFTSRTADLFGVSPIGPALEQIDALMELAALNADEALEGLRQNKGQVLAAYRALLQFVADSDTPFQYRWSEPALMKSRGASVTPVAAKAMCAILDTEQTLQTDPFEFTGQFRAVNTDREPYTWAARDDESKVRRGVLHEDHRDVLDGVTIKTTRYVFSGEERLIKPAAGRQVHKLFLKSVQPA